MKTSRRTRFTYSLLFNLSSICCVLGCIGPVSAESPKARRPLLIGISLAGPEFGAHLTEFSNQNPGVAGQEYTFPTEETIEYFATAGVDLIRLPFRWERIQPRLGQELDARHLGQLKKVTRTAFDHGMFVILDVHNYGRYRLQQNGLARDYVIDERVAGQVPVGKAHFTDLWKRLALEFRGDKSVVGYGLMNEPHDMGNSDWKEISQAAVDVIRKYDRETALVVAGDDWSSAEHFPVANGSKAWIRDPANHVVYEAHCYFDSDSSGKYRNSFGTEQHADRDLKNRGVDRVLPFLTWCHRNHVRGLIGEYGTPNDTSWREVTERFLDACRDAQVGVCYWAAGEWWGDYPLSVQPTMGDATVPQLRWLLDAKKNSAP